MAVTVGEERAAVQAAARAAAVQAEVARVAAVTAEVVVAG